MPENNSRYDNQGYRRDGRRKITSIQAPDRPGLNEYYALQNRSIPAFSRPGGPMSASDVARTYRDQGLQLGPQGISPRMYGAPQRQAPGTSSRSYTPVYTSDRTDSSSFGQQIAEARRRAESGSNGVLPLPQSRSAPSPVNFAESLGPDSLLGRSGGFSAESPVITQNDFEDVQSFAPARTSTEDQASVNRMGLELLRDAKRGNKVTNQTPTGAEITSNYGTAKVERMTPEQFANRPQATIEGMPASEWFKRSASRQNEANKYSTVQQGRNFVNSTDGQAFLDKQKADAALAKKEEEQGRRISEELRKRKVPAASSYVTR